MEMLGIRLRILHPVPKRPMVAGQGVRVRVWQRLLKQQAVCGWVRVGLEVVVVVVCVWRRMAVEIALRRVCHVRVRGGARQWVARVR